MGQYIRSFVATDDAGTEYTIDVYGGDVRSVAQPFHGPATVACGPKSMFTREGTPVSYVGPGQLRIISAIFPVDVVTDDPECQ